ncbi:DNA-deoxyinosine glycosylase [Caproiciproducens sp. R1]|uniref:DNA-deoxyinosine glycosylase n=1 Tax=Caproiciproducens sp. R1 TaxID=3435000 RepID=UPI0005705436
MTETVEHTFGPVYDENSRILILGTIPSPKSREYGFYYSHPQNRFWRIVSDLYGQKLPEGNAEKTEFLLRNRIALWDVLKSCKISGADDGSIRDPVANDIGALLKETDIRAVFTTGTKAAALYHRFCEKSTGCPAFALPSTSPANCRHYNYESLREAYRVILKYTME